MKNFVLFFVSLFALFAFGFAGEATASGRDQQVVVMMDGVRFVYSDRDYNRSPRSHRGYGYQQDRRYNRSHRDRYNRSHHRSNRGWDDSRRSYGYRGNSRGGCYRNCGQPRSHYRAEQWQRYYYQPPRYGPPRHRHSRGCGHR